jgi:uncharacterized repeat protein (TIGR03803 family)
MTYQGGLLNDGMIFSIATTGGNFTDLHDFTGGNTDGENTYGTLIISGGTLYGMAYIGGMYGDGIIFSIATTGGNFTDLHDFNGGAANDGAIPWGELTLSGSTLYGMTHEGGNYGDGIIFSIPITGGTLSDLHDFSGTGTTTDGATPWSSLIISGSTLYGMTDAGGTSGNGMIFSIATTGGNFTPLHQFSGYPTDGSDPIFTNLTRSGNIFYGLTFTDGANYYGMIFSMTTTGGNYQDIYDFTGSTTDGADPTGSLLLLGSTLYGMAMNAGLYGSGTLFSIPITGGTITDLHDFSGFTTDGATPRDDLILVGNTLYGMTLNGGTTNEGTIFSYTLSSSSYATFFGQDF